jgi:leader peptidase (prepilin peptidase)/N-methyltransferase
MPLPSIPESIAILPWAEAAMTFFGFAWGAMLGSFINVVVHRVPQGCSIVSTPSRCPTCGTAIRPSDNVPVFGWLVLGGRCRACREPIAATYPLVEAFCGAIVMLLAATELVGGGCWLASYEDSHPAGIDRLLWGDWSLLSVCAVHAAAVLTVVTWSLLDGVGYRLKVMTLAVPIALALITVALVPAASPPQPWPGRTVPGGVASLAGAAAGAVLGLARRGQGVRAGLALLGSVLGWQSVTLVAVVATVAGWAIRPWVASPARPGLVLAVVATLALAFGGLLHQFIGS